MSTRDHLERKQPTSSSSRPGFPQSPHTPQRGIASAFSSPAAAYRAEDESVVLQIGSRQVLAGFAGDTKPRCTVTFGGVNAQRVADYRRWLPGFETSSKPRRLTSEWGKDRELWNMDLRGLDLCLVHDKLERAIREVYTKHLLLDSKSRKVVLAVPSVLPHSLINTILSTLFNNFQVPSISMFPLSPLAVLAAGQRSGVVVDIGWHETVVTCVYDFREVQQARTTRAVKSASLAIGKLLDTIESNAKEASSKSEPQTEAEDERIDSDLDLCEDIATRFAWCAVRPTPSHSSSTDTMNGEDREGNHHSGASEPRVLTLTRNGQQTQLDVPLPALDVAIQASLVLEPGPENYHDDEELSIPYLLYQTLLDLLPDTRAGCISNIIFTGGGAGIPGLKTRIVSDLSDLVHRRGWNPVCRKQPQISRRQAGSEIAKSHTKPQISQTATAIVIEDGQEVEVATKTPIDNIKQFNKHSGEIPQLQRGMPSGNQIRSLSTLGSWSGASLAASMKVRSMVEIEREAFLQTGIAGAKGVKDSEFMAARAKQSGGTTLKRASGLEGALWTLGIWA